MDQHGRSLRFGAAVILCAVVLRLGGEGLWQRATRWLRDPDTQSFLIYLETGRKVRFSPSFEEKSNSVGESPPPLLIQTGETEPAALSVFSAEEAAAIEVSYSCNVSVDMEALLQQPLSWNLGDGEVRVLILHTHATESYTKNGEDYTESSAFRTLDEQYNMVSIGERVAQLLEAAGIGVIHDRQLHDYPSYNGSYSHARKSIKAYLEEYPTILLVLDLHRDASGDINRQLRPVATVDGERVAQMMLVMGTNASGQTHPNWRENLALGLKLQVQLERQAPGITRAVNLRAQRFNQDLTAGSLLIEMGAAGNTHAEALRAAEQLAKAIIALSRGTE